MEIIEAAFTLSFIYFFAPSFIISETGFNFLNDRSILLLKRVLSKIGLSISGPIGLGPVQAVSLTVMQATETNIGIYKKQLALLLLFLIYQWGKLFYYGVKFFQAINL